MSNILKKVVFLIVLAGLLTWGVATMAQGPSFTSTAISKQATMSGHQGQALTNGLEVSRDQVTPVGH